MSDEQTQTEAPETTETVEEVQEATMEEVVDTATTGNETQETESTSDEEKPDLVADAVAENKRLSEEIEALKSSSTNAFEENANLKAELADAQKAAELATENQELKAKLESIKRDAITASLGLTDKMAEFVDSLTFEQLQVYAENAPKRKTILDEKNSNVLSTKAQDFLKVHNKSRIM